VVEKWLKTFLDPRGDPVGIKDQIIHSRKQPAQLVDPDDVLRHPLKVIHHFSTRFSTTPASVIKIVQIRISCCGWGEFSTTFAFAYYYLIYKYIFKESNNRSRALAQRA
jgi:hypothetical protein